MKKHITLLALAGAVACIGWAIPTTSQAALFGQVSTAYTLDKGTNDMGGFVSAFEGSALAFGQYRRGLFSKADFGLQAGLVDPEAGDIGLALGGDMKFLIMQTDANTPFDLALDPRFGYIDFDSFSLFSIGGSVVISRDYALQQGSLAPYGAINLRLERTDYNLIDGYTPVQANAADAGEGDNTDFEMSGIAGVRWDVSELLDILGEVVLDHDIGFTMGLNFKL